MNKLKIPEPISGGIILSYKCNSSCKHCMYACSPKWKGDWISEDDAEMVLTQLSEKLRKKYFGLNRISVNYGLHFTGGEPFLNFDLLLKVTEIAKREKIPFTFVETNCFWCRNDETAREKLTELKNAGLDGILISTNPFIVEYVPFEQIERAARIGEQVFGKNVMIYQRFFFEQFKEFGLKGTLSFDEYLQKAGRGSLYHVELLPMGRVSYKLNFLYQKLPASQFFGKSCQRELIRDWHIHIDNYGNYVPGYCGGLSLGDARNMDSVFGGIDLDKLPVLKSLLNDLKKLYQIGKEYGYNEQEGYISKCHLCLDIRRHLVKNGEFSELKPKEFYERIDDSL